MQDIPKYAVIVAGGSGSRMQSEIPKQFLLLNDKPILFYTIEKFYHFDSSIRLLLVLPQKDISYWHTLCLTYNFTIPIEVIAGGDSRYASVKNGLAYIAKQNTEALVAIHDGVRPLVKEEVISESFRIAEQKGSAVASVALKDSIRKIAEQSSENVPRNAYRLIQTPQTFLFSQIWSAFCSVSNSQELTDDASVYEKAGFQVFLIDGNYENIKITTPEDLKIALAFLK